MLPEPPGRTSPAAFDEFDPMGIGRPGTDIHLKRGQVGKGSQNLEGLPGRIHTTEADQDTLDRALALRTWIGEGRSQEGETRPRQNMCHFRQGNSPHLRREVLVQKQIDGMATSIQVINGHDSPSSQTYGGLPFVTEPIVIHHAPGKIQLRW